VSINTDDPSMFGTDMNNEFLQLYLHLGFGVSKLFDLSLNTVDSLFINEERKIRMRESFVREYNRLLNTMNH
jgi:adenosine deaminase